MFSMAMWMAALVAPIQNLAGDTQGLNTQEYQPAKVMAMEGHFDSYARGAPLVLFGIPDEVNRRMTYSVEIPRLSSLILAHDINAPLAGLDTIPRRDWPPVAIIFWSFRVMVALGLAILGLGLFSLLARALGRLYQWTLLHRLTVLMGPAGFIAVIAGWVTTEVGRQPFTVYHALRTADSVSPVASPAVTGSLIAFVLVYFGTFVSGAIYILKLMAKPPSEHESVPEATPTRAAGITPAAALNASNSSHTDPHRGDE
jgi:cytochrome d ubiquinol oxidase subunit I